MSKIEVYSRGGGELLYSLQNNPRNAINFRHLSSCGIIKHSLSSIFTVEQLTLSLEEAQDEVKVQKRKNATSLKVFGFKFVSLLTL